MRLPEARVLIAAAMAVLVAAGLLVRLQAERSIDRHRGRVVDLCAGALAASGLPQDDLRRAIAEDWKWGSYDFPARLVADRLSHRTERFPAIRVSHHERLPGAEPRCRMTMCVYSIPLDRIATASTEARCGGGGATELVTPTLKPDILRAR